MILLTCKGKFVKLTKARLNRCKNNGYTAVKLTKHLYLVRQYSKNCSSSFYKRYLSPYRLIWVTDIDSEET